MKKQIALHDNARLHASQHILLKLKEVGYDTLYYPEHASNLWPIGYHFFKHADNFLRDECFKNEDENRNVFNAFLAVRGADFYSGVINKLIHREHKRINRNGSYSINKVYSKLNWFC